MARLVGNPKLIGEDGYRTSFDEGIFEHIANSRHSPRFFVVKTAHLAAEYWRARHQRNQHSGKIKVDCKLMRPIAFRAAVKPAHRFSDKLKLGRVFEINFVWDRPPCSLVCQVRITNRAISRTVDYAARTAASLGPYAPTISRGRNQHRTRSCTQLSVLWKGVSNRGRAAHPLDADQRIFVDICRRREFSDHLRPISVHLVGQNHRQCGVRALANFDSIDLNDDLAVRPNVDKRIWRINLRGCSLPSFLSRRW